MLLLIQDKSPETMSFIISILGRLESEKYSMVLKEIISLTNRYPKLLTAALIAKLDSLEEGSSSAARTYIMELRNEFNSRSREKLHSDAGVTIVKVGGGGGGGSKHDLKYRSSSNSSSALTAAVNPAGAHLYQQTPTRATNYYSQHQATTHGSRGKLSASSHRSMTKLNQQQQQSQQQSQVQIQMQPGFDSRVGALCKICSHVLSKG